MPHRARFGKWLLLPALLAAALAVASWVWWRTAVPRASKTTIPTVGILNPNPAWEPAVEGLKASLGRLGFREGETVRYLYRGVLPRVDMLDAEALRLTRRGVDVLVAITTPATSAAKRTAGAAGIPIVFSPSNDPVGAGLVAGLRAPGANLTGIQTGGSGPKTLEWLRAADRRVSKVLVLHDPADQSSVTALGQLRAGAAKQGLALVTLAYPAAQTVSAALEKALAGTDAVFILPASRWVNRTAEVTEATARRGLPTAAVSPVAERGVLVVYGPDPYRVGVQAAGLTAQILRGIPARDLPVETSEIALTVNLRAARAIGLDVSDTLLLKADRVVR